MAPLEHETLARETTVAQALKSACIALTDELGADACHLSRVLGQLLIALVEHSRDGRQIQLGRGYLVPDFPLTQAVLETGEPRRVFLSDPNVDRNEADLLIELGFQALVMLPLSVEGRCWGLFEVYRAQANAFEPLDVTRAMETVESTAIVLETLQRRAAA